MECFKVSRWTADLWPWHGSSKPSLALHWTSSRWYPQHYSSRPWFPWEMQHLFSSKRGLWSAAAVQPDASEIASCSRGAWDSVSLCELSRWHDLPLQRNSNWYRWSFLWNFYYLLQWVKQHKTYCKEPGQKFQISVISSLMWVSLSLSISPLLLLISSAAFSSLFCIWAWNVPATCEASVLLSA